MRVTVNWSATVNCTAEIDMPFTEQDATTVVGDYSGEVSDWVRDYVCDDVDFEDLVTKGHQAMRLIDLHKKPSGPRVLSVKIDSADYVDVDDTDYTLTSDEQRLIEKAEEAQDDYDDEDDEGVQDDLRIIRKYDSLASTYQVYRR